MEMLKSYRAREAKNDSQKKNPPATVRRGQEE
jgi:hypothetical protein